MKRKAFITLLIIFLIPMVVWLAKVCMDMAELNVIRQQAAEVDEPYYTLVVNGKVINHNYNVTFDRFDYDADKKQFYGWENGVTEIPLFTVLSAMGADTTWQENGNAIIDYSGCTYIFSPDMQGLYPLETYEELLAELQTESHGETTIPIEPGEAGNLLLIWPEKPGYCFRREEGEYIVSLGSVHLLALRMDFTFDVDYVRGIVFFTSH